MPAFIARQGPARKLGIQKYSNFPVPSDARVTVYARKKLQNFKDGIAGAEANQTSVPSSPNVSKMGVLPRFSSLTFLCGASIIRPWHAPMRFAESRAIPQQMVLSTSIVFTK
jgi:hypothetical protein